MPFFALAVGDPVNCPFCFVLYPPTVRPPSGWSTGFFEQHAHEDDT